jgi:hypothetical protein
MNEDKTLLILGLGLIFAAPLVHVVHYFVPETPFPIQYYAHLKDFIWMMMSHTELMLTVIGFVIVASFKVNYIHLLGLSPIIHSMIDLSLNVWVETNKDVWIIHVITYGSFVCVQTLLIIFWISKNKDNV